MNHLDAQNSMADYLDGDLPLEQRARFDAHLDTCEECVHELEQLRQIPYLLKGLPEVEPPAMLTHDVMRKIRLGEAEPRLWDRVGDFFAELASPGIAIPAGAMVAAFFLAVTSGQFEWSPVRTTPRSAVIAQSASASSLAPIPREAAALASEILRPAPQAVVPQMVRGGDGTLVAARPRAVFELLPVRSGDKGVPGVLPNSPQRVRIVVRRPSLGSRFAGAGLGMPRSADDWLAVVLQEPAEFARRQSSLSLAEREHWVRVLAQRAVETDSSQAVLIALRRSGTAASLAFAGAFAAESEQATAVFATAR